MTDLSACETATDIKIHCLPNRSFHVIAHSIEFHQRQAVLPSVLPIFQNVKFCLLALMVVFGGLYARQGIVEAPSQTAENTLRHPHRLTVAFKRDTIGQMGAYDHIVSTRAGQWLHNGYTVDVGRVNERWPLIGYVLRLKDGP